MTAKKMAQKLIDLYPKIINYEINNRQIKNQARKKKLFKW